MPPTRIKRSNTSSAIPASLEDGEIAINQATGALFYRVSDGSVGVLASGGAPVYTLPTASSTVLGGVKVGAGLSISSGVLSATGGGGGGSGPSLSNSTPAALGTASAGTSDTASRSDHVHAVPSYSSLSGIPSTFAPSYHTHSAADLTGVVATSVTGITGATTVTNIVALTQAQYNAITSPSSTTLYIIKAG